MGGAPGVFLFAPPSLRVVGTLLHCSFSVVYGNLQDTRSLYGRDVGARQQE